jgi:hypothetical protein
MLRIVMMRRSSVSRRSDGEIDFHFLWRKNRQFEAGGGVTVSLYAGGTPNPIPGILEPFETEDEVTEFATRLAMRSGDAWRCKA